MQGVREGSWGNRSGQPGTVHFHTEASPTGNHTEPEGSAWFLGPRRDVLGVPSGRRDTGKEKFRAETHTEF